MMTFAHDVLYGKKLLMPADRDVLVFLSLHSHYTRAIEQSLMSENVG